jgi:predicted flavoprotein YhiN
MRNIVVRLYILTLNGAKEILEMLVSECDKTNNVDIQTQCEAVQIDPLEKGGFTVHTNHRVFVLHKQFYNHIPNR